MHKHELLKVIHIAYETNGICRLRMHPETLDKKNPDDLFIILQKNSMNSGLIQHFLTSLNLPQMVDLFVFGYVLEISWYVK